MSYLFFNDPFNFDPTFTTKNVVNSIRDVTNWFGLGIQLEIKYSELETIRNDRRDTDPCKEKMVILWRERYLTASWQKLCNALENIGEVRVALQIVLNYPFMKWRQKEEEIENEKILQKIAISNHYKKQEERFEQSLREWDNLVEQQTASYSYEQEDPTCPICTKPQCAWRPADETENNEELREILRKNRIEWINDVLKKSAAEREKLVQIKNKMQAQTEGGRIFMERAEEIKKKKKELESMVQEFDTVEKSLMRDQEELQKRLQLLGDSSHHWTHKNAVSECKDKLKKCCETLNTCREQIKICKQELKNSDSQLSHCENKLKFCIGNLQLLQKDYERCIRAVESFENSIQKAMEELVSNWAKILGATAGAAIGGLVGTPFLPIVGTAIGAAIGGAVGWLGGTIIGEMKKEERIGNELRSQLGKCKSELKACEDTRRDCEKVVKEAIKVIN